MKKELRNSELAKLHEWLSSNVDGYVALCEAGSTTAGDPWVEGRSDRDVTIVFSEINKELRSTVQAQLGRVGFDDTYLFIMFPQDYFLETQSEQDLSMKFRGETLYGEDLVKLKELPTREFAQDVAHRGLSTMSRKFSTRLLNSDHWSIEHLRDMLYPEFKRLIMYLAAAHYAQTGEYPRRRLDVAEAYNSEELRIIADTIATIESATREILIVTTKHAIGFLSDFSVNT
ncbi:MAG: hypothetical protein HQ488_03805 [Parcubacteria group bacterium]|nr:hypothetical protein [Parcubacteria group bacterium]